MLRNKSCHSFRSPAPWVRCIRSEISHRGFLLFIRAVSANARPYFGIKGTTSLSHVHYDTIPPLFYISRPKLASILK
jgi:hypothetical protein